MRVATPVPKALAVHGAQRSPGLRRAHPPASRGFTAYSLQPRSTLSPRQRLAFTPVADCTTAAGVISARRLYIPSILCRKTALPGGLLSVEGRMNMRNAVFELISRGLRLVSIVVSGRDQCWVTSTTFTALLLMAVGSTMLTVSMATPQLRRLQALVFKAA